MNISTKGRYGLRAMLYLAEHYDEKPITLSTIASEQLVSEGYLEQLMVPLKRNGLVKSVRGAQGGYILARSPEMVMAGEVFRAVEGSLSLAACVSEIGKEDCSQKGSCATRILWQKVQDSITTLLDSYSLADLLRELEEEQKKE